MNIRRCGDRALLVEVADLETVLGLYATLTESAPDGVTELVPAARTLLVRYDSRITDAQLLAERLRDTEITPLSGGVGELVTIPTVYDGEDLADAGEATGLGVDGVIELHAGAEYRVAFSGFAPGFGYLTGLDPRLHLPRRSTPRVHIPAGSVAVAGEFTGVYPRSSPGGWQLLGHTDVQLWDPRRENPALLRPGTRVRFEPTDAAGAPVPVERPAATVSGGRQGIEVRACGPATTVQDLGRPGHSALGVGRSGAADRRSAALANRLVGNRDGAGCLELTLGNADLVFRTRARVAVTGAPCPITRAGRGEAMNASFTVHAGERLVVGAPGAGLRTYLAVRGGIDVEPVLGSRATDLLSGLGPKPLAAGDVLPIGTEVAGPPPAIDVAPVAAPAAIDLIVRVLPGPRDDWFDPDALRTLTSGHYVVTPESNRVGVRLSGPQLHRMRDGELASEGMVPGALQVPPSGQPVLFLADHPVTGGYPVIAVVLTEDLPVMAQARPGQRVSFRLAATTARKAEPRQAALTA